MLLQGAEGKVRGGSTGIYFEGKTKEDGDGGWQRDRGSRKEVPTEEKTGKKGKENQISEI